MLMDEMLAKHFGPCQEKSPANGARNWHYWDTVTVYAWSLAVRIRQELV